MSGLRVMLPRRTAGGQLFLGAFTLTEVLNITNTAVTKVTKEVGASLTLTGVSPKGSQPTNAIPNPERPRYPLQMLSHCYVPFGATRKPAPEGMELDADFVDAVARGQSKYKTSNSTAKDGEVKEKSKKRKKAVTQDESGAPKKSKRAKQAAQED